MDLTPPPAAPSARAILKRGRARPFFGRHPWVFAGAIARVEAEPADGDVVDLYSHRAEFIGRGLYNSRSNIRLRLYTWDAHEALDAAFWRRRIEAAARLRRDVLGYNGPPSPCPLPPAEKERWREATACRLVFSEGDGLSGLIVDRYDDWLVVQFTSLALAMRRDAIVRILIDTCSPRGIYLRTERGIGAAEGLELRDALLWSADAPTTPSPLATPSPSPLVGEGRGGGKHRSGGEPHAAGEPQSAGDTAISPSPLVGEGRGGGKPHAAGEPQRGGANEPACAASAGLASSSAPPLIIREHGIRYHVDLATGQKTGFYLDQRENRAAAARYLRGRTVLDAFCYSGGFGLAALLLGGAREVLAFDASEAALRLARANAHLNASQRDLPTLPIHFEQGQAFPILERLVSQRRRFGAVVLDPPKFARTAKGVDEALSAYHHLNRLAVELLDPDGILVTCSCSGHVTPEMFELMLAGVAEKSARPIRILERRGQAPDHPISASCLETAYLKCFICAVE